MKKINLYLLLFIMIISDLSLAQSINVQDIYQFSGRIEKLKNGQVKLLGSASSVSFQFSGATCEVVLSLDTPDHYNYVSIELDGKYIERLRIDEGKAKSYSFVATQKKTYHTLIIYKATEFSNGGIIFHEATANKLQAWQEQPKKKVEFIGDSVFCGQGIDYSESNCGTEKFWFDQHNAYFTYPVLSAHVLDYDFQISAVSGMGIYRNWNSEAEDDNAMPSVYEYLKLNKFASELYDFSFKPDIIVIGLGNNDFYEGDGKTPRAEYNRDFFITAYIKFMQLLSEHNPDASFVLVTPFLEGSNLTVATECMDIIKSNFPADKVAIFAFKPMELNGCNNHPDIKDSKIMAKQFIEFMRALN